MITPIYVSVTQGDIRSRLIRLIQTVEKGSPLDAIRTLLAHRLSSNASGKDAREEWRDIVEGHSHLWTGIPNDRKELIRGKPTHRFRSIHSQLLRHQGSSSVLRGSYSNVLIRISHSQMAGKRSLNWREIPK